MTQTSYRLIRVETSPAVCDHCGRECPNRHLVIADPTGTETRLGTSCAYDVAGIKPTDRIAATVQGTPEESAAFVLSWMNE